VLRQYSVRCENLRAIPCRGQPTTGLSPGQSMAALDRRGLSGRDRPVAGAVGRCLLYSHLTVPLLLTAHGLAPRRRK
jgi:hypothetical protein